MASQVGWAFDDFLELYREARAPELLLLILIDALGELERLHRGRAVLKTLGLRSIAIDSDGTVHLVGATESAAAAGDLSEELARLVALFESIEGPRRSWPRRLRRAFGSARRRQTTVWGLRARLLDVAARIGVAGERFRLSRFLVDPGRYVRALAALEAQRHRSLLALRARLTYAAFLAVVAAGSAPVILDKIGLGSSPAKLTGRRPAAGYQIEPLPVLTETVHPLGRRGRAGWGAIVLDLENGARAWFDGAPGEVPSHSSRDMIWMSAGRHVVTVEKPGLPAAVATVQVRDDALVELGSR